MPKIVDHEQRRRDVATVAERVVLERGRTALTVRNVAEAAGMSTTIVSHYFDGIADLLYATYSLAVERASARIQAVVDADPSDVEGLIFAVLPLDAQRRRDWKIWLAFWSEALSSPAFATEQRRRARTTARRLENALHELAAAGRLAPGVDVCRAGDRLAALIPGIAAEAIFDPRNWSATYQRSIVRDELRMLGLIGES